MYDPFSLPKNDAYNLEKSKAHGGKEFDYNTKLILFPTASVEHSIETILSSVPKNAREQNNSVKVE